MVKLVLVRHGESQWNLLNEFTGWVDVAITQKGEEEAKAAAKRLASISFDVAFTSQLMRAHQTLCLLFQERPNNRILIFKHNTVHAHTWEHYQNAKKWEVPVFKSQSLNERYYGDLQGLNKEETVQKFGEEQVHIWRRSFDVKPPQGESLEDVTKRTIPYYENHILPFIKAGKNVIVVAHGNSLRSIIMHLDHMSPEQIINFELKTAVPVLYELDENGKVLHRTILS